MKSFIDKIFFVPIAIVMYFTFCGTLVKAQIKTDSTKIDSARLMQASIINQKKYFALDSLLKKNKYLNAELPAVSLAIKNKTRTGKEPLFYIIAIIILVFGLLKVFYAKYFNNIFRVFFNTSLRQNQLTDLLLQAKLPSLIFNVFFVISFGLYLWLIINNFSAAHNNNNYVLAASLILFVLIIYLGKFVILKFIGWISGISEASDQYIFIIFLINKIIGVLLIPFIIFLAFAPSQWFNIIAVSSFFVLGLFFLLRYLRSYGLLKNQFKFYSFHFLLYIAAIEILPALIIYKSFIRFAPITFKFFTVI